MWAKYLVLRGSGGGGGSDTCVADMSLSIWCSGRVSVDMNARRMQRIWVPGHPGETYGDPGTPSPP